MRLLGSRNTFPQAIGFDEGEPQPAEKEFRQKDGGKKIPIKINLTSSFMERKAE